MTTIAWFRNVSSNCPGAVPPLPPRNTFQFNTNSFHQAPPFFAPHYVRLELPLALIDSSKSNKLSGIMNGTGNISLEFHMKNKPIKILWRDKKH